MKSCLIAATLPNQVKGAKIPLPKPISMLQRKNSHIRYYLIAVQYC